MSVFAAVIWTQDIRKELYRLVLKIFGPQSSWDVSSKPNDRKAYVEFCRSQSQLLTTKLERNITDDAIDMQIRWAVTLQTAEVACTHVRNYLLCKTAAMEVGLIDRTGLPHTLTVNSKNNPKEKGKNMQGEFKFMPSSIKSKELLQKEQAALEVKLAENAKAQAKIGEEEAEEKAQLKALAAKYPEYANECIEITATVTETVSDVPEDPECDAPVEYLDSMIRALIHPVLFRKAMSANAISVALHTLNPEAIIPSWDVLNQYISNLSTTMAVAGIGGHAKSTKLSANGHPQVYRVLTNSGSFPPLKDLLIACRTRKFVGARAAMLKLPKDPGISYEEALKILLASRHLSTYTAEDCKKALAAVITPKDRRTGKCVCGSYIKGFTDAFGKRWFHAYK